MTKFIRPAIFALLAFFSLNASAQNISKADSLAKVYATTKAHGFYWEGLGAAPIYSFNYDTRFHNRRDGLGGRAGISYFAAEGDKLFSVPIMINYLLGKNGKYFEMGAGATFYHFRSDSSHDFFGETKYDMVAYPGGYYYEPQPNSETGVFGSLNFGYRYQPVDGGFSFRGGFSPIFSSHQFIPYWPYISFGYSF